MNTKTFRQISLSISIIFMAQLACASAQPTTPTAIASETLAPTSTFTSTPAPTDTPEPTFTPEPTPTPTFEFALPTPVVGRGTIVGHVLWNKEPVSKAAVKACENFDLITGCLGNQYSVNTNKQGYYIFENVKPGSYVIMININSTSWWIYHTASNGYTPFKYRVNPDKILYADPLYMYRVDLEIVEPAAGGVVAEAQPVLKWAAYDGAAYYTLEIKDYDGRITNYTTTENEYAVEAPLIDCTYQVIISAYNDEDMKISQNEDWQDFIVDSEPNVSCMMTVLEPPRDAILDGKDIKLAWEGHPLAEYYEISIENGRQEIILPKTKLDKGQTSYILSLPPGRYFWDVYSYDAGGNELMLTYGAFDVR